MLDRQVKENREAQGVARGLGLCVELEFPIIAATPNIGINLYNLDFSTRGRPIGKAVRMS